MIHFDLRTLKSRIIRASKLDVKFYEEISSDDTALVQSIAIIIASALAAGIGSALKFGWSAMFLGTISSLVSWFLWLYIVYLLGTKIFTWSRTRVSFTQLLSTAGFSAAPGLIRILGLIPFVGDFVFFIAAVWMLVAMVIAVRLALDYQRLKQSAIVCISAWIIHLLIILVIMSLLLRMSGVVAKV